VVKKGRCRARAGYPCRSVTSTARGAGYSVRRRPTGGSLRAEANKGAIGSIGQIGCRETKSVHLDVHNISGIGQRARR
jgi:hypothetical protein